MSYHDVVPPEQPQYCIEGHQLASTNINLAPMSSSEASLKLKPDRSAHAQQPQTPSLTEGSEQESLCQHLREAEARATEQQRQAAKQAELKGHVRDALDEAIEEAKTVRDLVSNHSLVMSTVLF